MVVRSTHFSSIFWVCCMNRPPAHEADVVYVGTGAAAPSSSVVVVVVVRSYIIRTALSLPIPNADCRRDSPHSASFANPIWMDSKQRVPYPLRRNFDICAKYNHLL